MDCSAAGSPNYCGWPNSSHLTSKPAECPGIFADNGVVASLIAHVTDGTSNTLLLSERKGELSRYKGIFSDTQQGCITGMKINSVQIQPMNSGAYANNCGASSHHVGGGAHFAMADGAVRFISENIDFVTYNNLGNKRDGATLGEF